MSQFESVSYPKIRQRPDGRVELIVYYQNKRMRLQNGHLFGLNLKPNSFPIDERLSQAKVLAAKVYSLMIAGVDLNDKARVNGLSSLNDLEILEKVLENYNANLYLCCLLTYGCLLRPHREVRELTWGDFSKDLSTIRLSGSRNKSGRNRVVPVPSYVREMIRPSIPEHNLFTGDLRPPNPDYFKSAWGRFKKRSELLKEGQTLYSFRHTGAIDIYKRTGSIEKLKSAMRHSNIMVSLTYLRGLDVAELREEDMPVL